METFEALLATKFQAERAIGDFWDHCTVLQNMMFDRSIDQASRNKLVHNIRSSLGSFEHMDNRLVDCHTMLRRLANLPSDLALIMHLPPEILSRIFVFTTSGNCTQICEAPLPDILSIMAVCSRWKHVAEDTVALWTHIDVSGDQDACYPAYPPRLSDLSVTHSKTASLYIHVAASVFWEVRPYAHALPQVLGIILPHAPRITSLHFGAEASSSCIAKLFRLCEEHGTRGLKSLVIEGCVYDFEQIPWHGKFFNSLVDLQISCLAPEVDLRGEELVALLAACPSLNSLSISHILLTTDFYAEGPTVKLLDLRYLCLREIGSSGIVCVLSAIETGTQELHFEVEMLSTDTEVDAISLFMMRSKIANLTLWSSKYVDGMVDRYFASLQDLQSLTFVNIEHRKTARALDSLLLTSNLGRAARFPTLASLLFVDSAIYGEIQTRIMEVVRWYSLRTIGFTNCTIYANEDEPQPEYGPNESILDWLGSQGTAKVLQDGCIA